MNPILYGPDDKPLPTTDSTGRSHKDNKQTPSKTKTLPPLARFLYKSAKSVYVWAGVVATAIAIYAVFPRVSVTPSETTTSDVDAFRVFLYVSNDGQFTVYDTAIKCVDMEFRNPSKDNALHGLGIAEPDALRIGDLDGGGHATTLCPLGSAIQLPLMAPGDEIAARMNVVMSFRPSFWPRRIERVFHLRAHTEPDKHIHWILTSH